MSFLATLILLFFIWRFVAWTLKAWTEGQVFGAILHGAHVVALLVPLVTVWS
jgi:hypothetical protein